MLEVNPRASRTVPFVSKATGVPLAKVAAKVMVGKTLDELGITDEPMPAHVSVKESVFPFNKFPGVDIILGPEMRSTGEVMGIDDRLRRWRSPRASWRPSSRCRESGTVFVSVADRDKPGGGADRPRGSPTMGYQLIAHRRHGRGPAPSTASPSTTVRKIHEGRPNLLDHLTNGAIALIINTPSGKGARTDEGRIRAAAVSHGVPCITTLAGARAAVAAMERLRAGEAGCLCVAGPAPAIASKWYRALGAPSPGVAVVPSRPPRTAVPLTPAAS